MTPSRDSRGNRHHLLVAALCSGFVALMVGVSFAAVPLYDLFCRVTGFGGTTQVSDGPVGEVLDQTIIVRFDSNVSGGLPWRFRPKQSRIEVRIGEMAEMVYVAENTGAAPTVGTSTYNVSPPQVGIFFNKMECFCFTEQPLEPGETVEMPVVFFVDPAIVEDVDGRAAREITLSYTFFPVQGEGRERPVAAKRDSSAGQAL